jgi:hypothetical protein
MGATTSTGRVAMFATVIAPGESMATPPANANPLCTKKITQTTLSFRHVMSMPPMKELKRHTTERYAQTDRV